MYRRWDKSKPIRGSFTLNNDAPQAQGLVAWWPVGGASAPTYVSDLAGGYPLVPGTGPSRVGLSQSGAPVLNFTAASSQYLTNSTTPVTGKPLTLASWVRPVSSGTQVVLGLTNGVGGGPQDDRYLIYVSGAGPLNAHSQQRVSGGSANAATSSNTFAVGTEAHIVGRFLASAVPRISLNGVHTSGTGTDQNPLVDRIEMGRLTNASLFIDGDVGESGLWNIDISDANVQRLYDPALRFELWYPLRSRKWFTAGAGGDPALTNNLATTAAGTVVPSTSLVLTGNAATASAGTVAPDISLALTGNGATTAAGDVAVAGADPALTGSTATSSVGDVSPGITIALAGNGATASVGDVSPAISLALSGLAGTSAAGIVVPGLDLATTGNTATSAVGNVSPGGDVTLALTGNAATASAGTLSIGGPLTDAEFRQMYDWLQDLYGRQLLTVGTYIALK